MWWFLVPSGALCYLLGLVVTWFQQCSWDQAYSIFIVNNSEKVNFLLVYCIFFTVKIKAFGLCCFSLDFVGSGYVQLWFCHRHLHHLRVLEVQDTSLRSCPFFCWNMSWDITRWKSNIFEKKNWKWSIIVVLAQPVDQNLFFTSNFEKKYASLSVININLPWFELFQNYPVFGVLYCTWWARQIGHLN